MVHDLYLQGAPTRRRSLRHHLRLDTARHIALQEPLTRLGMLVPSTAPPPPQPPRPFGDEDFAPDGRPITAAALAYQQARARWLADPGVLATQCHHGIPSHKLVTNDGWHVTTAEATHAVHAYDTARDHGERHPPEFADDLVPFLRAAARYAGFLVH